MSNGRNLTQAIQGARNKRLRESMFTQTGSNPSTTTKGKPLFDEGGNYIGGV